VKAAECFAVNLTTARKRAGLTQEEVAFKAAIHPTWISHLESGRVNPTLSTIAKLASALEVEPEDLLAGGNQ
jgi:transcriptional regulator with XRE-family HTH domain